MPLTFLSPPATYKVRISFCSLMLLFEGRPTMAITEKTDAWGGRNCTSYNMLNDEIVPVLGHS